MSIYNAVHTYVEDICIKIAERMEGILDIYYFKVFTITYDDIHYFKLPYKLNMFIAKHKATNNKTKKI